MVLTYDRMLQIFIIAHSKSQITDNILTIRQQELTLKYSEYVKGLLHLNCVSGFYLATGKRSIFEYSNALKFLEGDELYRDDALKVLQYYYEDVSNFLLKNAQTVYLDLVVDCELGLEETIVNFRDVKHELMTVLHAACREVNLADVSYPEGWDAIVDSGEDLYHLIENGTYAFIFDECSSPAAQLASIINNLDNYALAAICKSVVKDVSNLKILKLEDYND